MTLSKVKKSRKKFRFPLYWKSYDFSHVPDKIKRKYIFKTYIEFLIWTSLYLPSSHLQGYAWSWKLPQSGIIIMIIIITIIIITTTIIIIIIIIIAVIILKTFELYEKLFHCSHSWKYCLGQ